MAQIWLTYEELGDFCGCSPAVARIEVARQQWTSRKSRDGQTRVKLPDMMMRDYIGRMAALWQGTEALADFEKRQAAAMQTQASEKAQMPAYPVTIDHDALADRMSSQLRSLQPTRLTNAFLSAHAPSAKPA